MSDTVQRKCRACGAWNDGSEDRCVNCGALINPTLVREQEHETREKKRLEVPKTPLDRVIDKLGQSRNPFIMALNAVLKAIWFVYWVILSFILWVIAAGPG